ncbi:hypothetical protein BJ742DRAFT_242339 [Cladochytrium replicatum]|nr:hypothetical protein BJ742DRAFT_242339 [Cladochytrium replicatum]
MESLKVFIKSNARIALVAAAASAAAAVAYTVGFRLRKRYVLNRVKKQLRQDFKYSKVAPGSRGPGQTDESLIREQLARNYAFLGEEGVNKVRKSFVIVIGLGGVGSHAAHMLLRSGVEHLRLIDFDQVTLSSLNRHAVARQVDVGTPKAHCLARHFREIAPHSRIEAVVEMFNEQTADNLLADNPTYVLDCIDNVDTKVHLIKYCFDNKIPVISSTGSGAKADASRIQIADISDTQEDPLARTTRRKLRALGIEKGVTVVYSTEKPNGVGLLPLEDTKVDNADEYATLPNFRARILPVLGTIPALFGNAMASYVITELAGYPVTPLVVQGRDATYARIHRDLSNREGTVFKSSPHLTVSIKDVGYIIEEMWNGRSALSGVFDRCTLTRWDIRKPAGFGNLICLTKEEAKLHHEYDPDKLAEVYTPVFVKFVEQKFREEASVNRLRGLR